MVLCYICNVHQGEICKIPYINEDSESIGVTSLFICGGCWQNAGKCMQFPMYVDTMLVALSVEEDNIVSSVLKGTVNYYESVIPVFQEFVHPLHPEFGGACHKCQHRQGFKRQVPWKKKDVFCMFETMLCQDCWKSLVLMPGSMPFRGDTWWDAFQRLKEIDLYRDLLQEELDALWLEEKNLPGPSP